MPNVPDGQYDRRAAGTSPLSWKRPWASNEERLTSMAIESALAMSSEEIRALPCPLPQIDPNPPRFGYDRRALGIRDIMNAPDAFAPSDAFSGGPGAYAGASRNTNGQGDGNGY